MGLARGAFWLAMVVWGVFEIRQARASRADDRSQDRGTFAWSLGAVLVGLIVAGLLDVLVPAAEREDVQTPFLAVGAALVVVGVALRRWAIVTLGRFFTYQVAIAPDQQVVSEGPYRWVRHPSYTGLLLSCFGAGIASGNAASVVAALAIPAFGLARRIRVEEAALLQALGAAYRDFMATRRKLVPGLW